MVGKKRHYHNAHHILSLLAHAQENTGITLKAPLLVDFAIVYHDIVYNVLRKDNELKSALLAAKRLLALGMHPYEAGLVKLYIEATQHHQVPQGLDHAEDLAFFLDFDMAILGAPWEDYQAYILAVRKEYNIYPDMLYKPGRKKFLEQTYCSCDLPYAGIQTSFRCRSPEQYGERTSVSLRQITDKLKMKFQIGDKVVVLHSNEEGEVVDIINPKMVMVDVRGVKVPCIYRSTGFSILQTIQSEETLPGEKASRRFL